MNIQAQIYNINFTARTKYPQIPKAEIKNYINMGYSYRKISEIYGIPEYAINRFVQTYGLQSLRTTNGEKEIIEIQRLYRQGKTPKEIKKELMVSEKKIEKAMVSQTHPDTLLEKVIKKLNLNPQDVKKYFK